MARETGVSDCTRAYTRDVQFSVYRLQCGLSIGWYHVRLRHIQSEVSRLLHEEKDGIKGSCLMPQVEDRRMSAELGRMVTALSCTAEL